MQVTYSGRHSEGVCVVLDDGEVFIGHGDTAELPDDVAVKLCEEQPDAFTIKSAPKKAASKAEEAA